MDQNEDAVTEEQEEYPYSMGTTAAVNTLLSLIETDPLNCDVIVFNISTLIRNCMQKEEKILKLYDLVMDELKKVENVLVDALNASMIKNPTLIWYAAPYEKIIPVKFLRPIIPSRQIMNATRLLVMRSIKSMGKDSMTVNGRVNIFYKALAARIQTKYQLTSIIKSCKTSNHVIMVSNFAVDLHTADNFPHFKLVECFTGKIVEPKDFGEKVFKNKVLPLNEVLHVIFGDKELMRPTATIGEKRKIIELATKEQWRYRTRQFIYDSIAKKFKALFDLKKSL